MIVRKILFILLTLVLLISCVKDHFYAYESDSDHRTDNAVYPSDNNVLGSWVVAFYQDLQNGNIIRKNDVESWGGLDVKLKFMEDSTFCGLNTSNEVAGHYILKDSTIKIDVYGGTKVGQPEWGNMFSDIVHSHTLSSFTRNKSQLKLFYNNHKNCIVLYQYRREIYCRWTYSN
jgi:hypothetical protein